MESKNKTHHINDRTERTTRHKISVKSSKKDPIVGKDHGDHDPTKTLRGKKQVENQAKENKKPENREKARERSKERSNKEQNRKKEKQNKLNKKYHLSVENKYKNAAEFISENADSPLNIVRESLKSDDHYDILVLLENLCKRDKEYQPILHSIIDNGFISKSYVINEENKFKEVEPIVEKYSKLSEFYDYIWIERNHNKAGILDVSFKASNAKCDRDNAINNNDLLWLPIS